MHDVTLILMPYAPVESTSLALGTLKACLVRAGISAQTIYGNIRFADTLGLQGYESINTSSFDHRIGEWTFAAAAFPDHDLSPEAYLDVLAAKLGNPPGLAERLHAVRELAGKFVDNLAQSVLESRPRIVGCSSLFQQQCASLALLRRVRELDPSVVTMLGGGNCEGEMGWTTHQSFDWVDFVVSGEADSILAPLCRTILDSGPDIPARALGSGVFGPVHRGGGSASAPRARDLYARIDRMDKLPTPLYDDYFTELDGARFKAQVVPGITIETARGCWWGEKHHCTFCGISDSGMAFRAKPAEHVIDEINTLHRRHGIGRFVAADSIIEPSYFESLIPALANAGQNFELFYQTKSNLKRHQVAKLAAAGIRWIQPGIESLDDRVQKRLSKGAGAAINVQLLKWSRNYGVWLLWNMLFGAPHEEDNWCAETAVWLPLIYHLQPPTGGLTPILYNRFSPYFNDQARFGIELEPGWAYRHTYPHDAERLAQQAYFFEDRRDAANLTRPWLRPGAAALNMRVLEWADLFFDTESATIATMRQDAPVLAVVPSGDNLAIHDSRPCALAPRHELSGLESRIYRLCDAATTPSALAGALAQAGVAVTPSEVDAALGRLLRLKLMLDIGGRMLSLATDGAPVPYPHPLDFPAGTLLRKSPGDVATQHPTASVWDVPLSELPNFFIDPGKEHIHQ